jgi:hypothetical protein
MDVLNNTLFIYILGDNGSSGEGGPDGAFNEIAALNGVQQSVSDVLPHLDEIGGPMAYNHFNVGWAHTSGMTTSTRLKSVVNTRRHEHIEESYAKSDLAKLKNRRTRITRRDRSK